MNADDVCTHSQNKQRIIHAVQCHGMRWCGSENSKQTAVMMFDCAGVRAEHAPCIIHWRSGELTWVSQTHVSTLAWYLGPVLAKDGSWDAHVSHVRLKGWAAFQEWAPVFAGPGFRWSQHSTTLGTLACALHLLQAPGTRACPDLLKPLDNIITAAVRHAGCTPCLLSMRGSGGKLSAPPSCSRMIVSCRARTPVILPTCTKWSSPGRQMWPLASRTTVMLHRPLVSVCCQQQHP
jgi:hypothetical protein